VLLQQFDRWWKQVNFPEVAKAPLGFGVEYWSLRATDYEGWEHLRDRLRVLGRRSTKRGLATELSSHLLSDVVVAAGGIEIAMHRLRQAAAELQAYADANKMKAQPGISQGLGHSAAIDLWYAFADVLSWSRTFVERLERRAENSKQFPKQGLVPALKPKRLRKRTDALMSVLRQGPVGEARPLVNFMLHTALVAHPLSGVRIDTSGRVTLPIPDAPTKSVKHWYLLTWNQGRDGLVVAEEIWRAIQDFMNELLKAFERAVPRRLRQ
jgi:hypothetical protein